MNIQELRAGISAGVVRTYRWRANFAFPSGTEDPDGGRLANILAKTANLPPATVGDIEINWGGRIVPVPGDREFTEWPVTFIATQDVAVWNSFMKWNNYLNGHVSNVAKSESLTDLTKDITMELLDGNDNVITQYLLTGAYPREVGELALDRGSRDEAGEFTVTFRYQEFEIAGVST